MTRTPYESAAAPTSYNAKDPAELSIVCRSKPNLANQTDSNATLLCVQQLESLVISLFTTLLIQSLRRVKGLNFQYTRKVSHSPGCYGRFCHRCCLGETLMT